MTYVGMQVADGQSAGLAWESMVRGCLEHSERDKTRKALLDYCGQDTLAMAKMIERLSLIPPVPQTESLSAAALDRVIRTP